LLTEDLRQRLQLTGLGFVTRVHFSLFSSQKICSAETVPTGWPVSSLGASRTGGADCSAQNTTRAISLVDGAAAVKQCDDRATSGLSAVRQDWSFLETVSFPGFERARLQPCC
jgi:hypothetical protein